MIRSFGNQSIAALCIKDGNMHAAITVNRISRHVKRWEWVAEHRLSKRQSIPIYLGDAITCFSSADRGELKRSVDECVQATNMKPFPERHEVAAACVCIRCITRPHQVGFRTDAREPKVVNTVKLKPVALVDSVVTPI